jgi:hypothetical protein
LSGTATPGTDYAAAGTSVVIPAGASSAVVNITVLDDAAAEGDETVIATINASPGYIIGAAGSATMTIADNDSGSSLNVADLVVLNVTASPANPAPGQQVLFSATVKNQGSVATPAGSIVGLGFYVDGGPVTSWVTQPSLAAGQTVTLTANDSLTGSPYWTATAGNHTVLAIVDDVNRIGEVVETNNSLALLLPVGVTNGTSTNAPVVKLAPFNGHMKLSWNSISGKVYQVCYKTSLTNTTWTPLGSPVTATGNTSTYLDTMPAGNGVRFYKVQMQ